MTIRLGCIADDFTGATDLANNLVRAGMRVVQTIGAPAAGAAPLADADAVVVALKSRTAPVGEAVAGLDLAQKALEWAAPRLGERPLLVYATAAPAAVQAVQARLGVERARALVEDLLSRIAIGLVESGVGRLVLAGGETSGACVQALGIASLRIGPQIDPGVPWCHAADRGLHLALKSGNFGATDFFRRAFASA
jgi:uncharacterized protein YgbK (DUF1537 family)